MHKLPDALIWAFLALLIAPGLGYLSSHRLNVRKSLFYGVASKTEQSGAEGSARTDLLRVCDGELYSRVLVDPVSKAPLFLKQRYFGVVKEEFLKDASSSNIYTRRYPISDLYIDLTVKEEVSKPIWEISGRERISSRLFQNPFMSSIYERGYRQNFERAGFPGIDSEFAEASAFFASSSPGGIGSNDGGDGKKNNSDSATVLLDLSCGSGFMSRRFVKSNQYVFCSIVPPSLSLSFSLSLSLSLSLSSIYCCTHAFSDTT
jgi:hypothetical protein